MSNTAESSKQRAWSNAFHRNGRVEIRASLLKIVWMPLFFAAIIIGVAVFTFLRDELSGKATISTTVIVSLVTILIVMWLVKALGGKSIIIDPEAIVTTDGQRVEWSDVTDVYVWESKSSRQAESLMIVLNDDAWHRYMGNLDSTRKSYHRLTKAFVKLRALSMPTYLDGSSADLAEWINRVPRGVSESGPNGERLQDS